MANGYRWWYVDALSDDRRFGLTVIVFVGSVFSPYYAWARRRGAADPASFCAVNAILYNPRSKFWALTERGAADLRRSADRLEVGPSAITREGDGYRIDIDEVTVPWPRRLRGAIKVTPLALHGEAHTLEAQGGHRWWPIAPVARVEVDFPQPGVRWAGSGYFDANWGDEPLECGFSHWHWSRAELNDGSVAVYYSPHARRDDARRDDARRDDARRTGSRQMAWRFYPDGRRESVAAGVAARLPATSIWRVARETRVDPGAAAVVSRTLEDTPFYARSLISSRVEGCDSLAVHESLDLNRFRQRWVQCLLPFRMPRFPRQAPR